MLSRLNQDRRIGFVVSWTLINAVCWPIGLLSGMLIGLAWIRLLVSLIPGRFELGYGLFPDHEYIQAFIWSGFLIGSSVTGLIVGMAQYGVLRKYYGISARWILISVLAWSLGGLSAKAADALSNLHPVNDRWAYTLLVVIPFGIGASVSGIWLGKMYIHHQHRRTLFILMYCLTWMLGAAIAWLSGPFPLGGVSSGIPLEIVGFLGFGMLVGGFSSIAIRIFLRF